MNTGARILCIAAASLAASASVDGKEYEIGLWNNTFSEWTFHLGAAFPGAQGNLVLRSMPDGKPAIILDGIFTNGGNHVSMRKKLDLPSFSGITLELKAPDTDFLLLRFTDGSGQCHTCRYELDSRNGWKTVFCTLKNGKKTHFRGGTGNGVWSGNLKKIEIVNSKKKNFNGIHRLYLRSIKIMTNESCLTTKTAVLDRQLQETPPLPHDPRRTELLKNLDGYFSAADSETTEELVNFYHHRSERALNEIENYSGKEPRLWKFYSSGVIVKADGIVGAFDLTRGYPVHPYPAPGRIFFTEPQVRRLVKLIDFAYFTHEHEDHLDEQLTRRLIDAGKLVIAPHDGLKRRGIQGAEASENRRKAILPGNWKMRVYQGFQHMTENSALDVPCNAGLFTFPNGKTLLVKGDIFHGGEFRAILDRIRSEGLRVDYFASSPFCREKPDIVTELRRDFQAFFIPCHEWEFSHRKPGRTGNATQNYAALSEQFAEDLREKRAAILVWGESLILK